MVRSGSLADFLEVKLEIAALPVRDRSLRRRRGSDFSRNEGGASCGDRVQRVVVEDSDGVGAVVSGEEGGEGLGFCEGMVGYLDAVDREGRSRWFCSRGL